MVAELVINVHECLMSILNTFYLYSSIAMLHVCSQMHMGVAHSEKRNSSHSTHFDTPCGVCSIHTLAEESLMFICCSQDRDFSMFQPMQ